MSRPTIYLLDTNMVSYIVTSRSAAARQQYKWLAENSRIIISAITEGEIRYGMARKHAGARLLNFMQRFLAEIETVSWDSVAAHAYGNLRAQLSAAGQTLSPLDLLIAGHAMSVGAVLVTHDRAFQRLSPSLPVQDWANDIATQV